MLNTGGAALRILYSYLQARLTWKWRKKLTDHVHDAYFQNKAYYFIGEGGGVKGSKMLDADHRIVEDLKVTDKGVKAKIKDSKGKANETEFSHCITAIGIVPNTENVGLDKLVEMDRGFIQIDDYGRTKSKGLWAIGDCTPGPWLAHKASHEGVTTAEAIARELGNKEVHPHPLDRANIPGCTYCHPQIASVGLTEAKAKEAGHDVKAGTFPFIGNGKAIALGEAEGFVKTVFDAKTGELLGAHMIGAEVTEMIQGFVVGKTLETTEAELMQTVFPHPTISESMHESVLASYGRALHI
ncbi:MAG: hypothetical protein CL948_09215 [Erythrobacter sp.]|nr:hypothetical protein [Erythrobacter sp.]